VVPEHPIGSWVGAQTDVLNRAQASAKRLRMKKATSIETTRRKSLRAAAGGMLLASALLCGATGCSSIFNPSFINLVATPVVDSTGAVPSITIDNAPGHVPVIFINNAKFDQNLIDYFDSIGIDTSDPNLRPRVRVRTDIRYVNGNTITLEFIDGSAVVQNTVQTANGTQQNPLIPRDLLQNDLTNVVAICDVSRVQPGGGIDSQETSVEVFVPAFLKEIQIVVNDLVTTRELSQTVQPQFVPLQQDEVDANLNVTLLRNFDIRDAPVPATDLLCGSVVGFTLSGTLRLPFVQDELGAVVPGYLDTDDAAQASIPGRFEFITNVR